MTTKHEDVERCGKCGEVVDLAPTWEGGNATPFDCVWCDGVGCCWCDGKGVTIICNDCLEEQWQVVVEAFRDALEVGVES